MILSKIVKCVFVVVFFSACNKTPAEEIKVTSAHFEENLLWLKINFQSSLEDVDIEGRNRIECKILPASVSEKYTLIGYANKEDSPPNFSAELHMMKDMQSTSTSDTDDVKLILSIASVIDCDLVAMNYFGPPIRLGHFSMDIKSITK